ncbi:hypothetical protein [Lentzea sp. NPDC003310]|uniref:hypothetical protein n=1 Tax=Lentzea sp. NPDC003310 TaxID=3154447 RepID=UPI0033AC2EE2
MKVRLATDTTTEPGMRGTVIYRVTVDGTWIGWIGDYRDWKGWRYGGRRWFACWRQDGDTAARWYRNELPTRTAARNALITRTTASDSN